MRCEGTLVRLLQEVEIRAEGKVWFLCRCASCELKYLRETKGSTFCGVCDRGWQQQAANWKGYSRV